MCVNLTNRIVEKNLIIASIGVVYLLLGILKFSTRMGPSEDIAIATIQKLTFGFTSPNVSIIIPAIWESLVGILLILGLYKRLVANLTLIHLIFTFAPLYFFPELIFTNSPFISFTLLGQYIVKNIIVVGTLITLLYESKEIFKPHKDN